MIERLLVGRLCQGAVVVGLVLALSLEVSSLKNGIGLPSKNCFGRSQCGISAGSSASIRHFSSLSVLEQLRGGNVDVMEEDEADEEAENEEEEEEDSEDEEEESKGPKVTTPLKLKIGTNLIGGSNAIDISPAIELMCSRSRSILSIKQSLSRSLRGRPPMELLQLVDSRTGQTLEDNMLVQELADEEEDDDEEEDGDPEVTLYLNMIPPVDPKFGTLLPEQIAKASTQQLLNMYTANVACMHANSNALFLLSNEEDDEEGEVDNVHARLVWDIKQRAMAFKEHILSNLLTEEQRQILQNEQVASDDGDEEGQHQRDSLMGGDVLLKESLKRKGRTAGIKGGATMQVKRALQKNLNINWPDTIRNFFLFLFFGYFGGRDVFSRTVMLLGAPMCFLLQLRPIKIIIKQLFYAIGHPPGIFLSLLPAPQQAIMSLDYNAAMRDLYGNDAANNLIKTAEEESGDDDEDNDVFVDDSESDESDFDDDDEYDDSDDE